MYHRQQVLATLAVFILTGLAGFYYLRRDQAEIRRRVFDQLESIASLKVQQIIQWRRERLGDARLLASMPDLAGSIATLAMNPSEATALRERLSEYLSTMESAYGYRQIVLFDRELYPVYVNAGTEVADTSLPADLRSRILQAAGPFMNELHATDEGRVHLDFISPVQVNHGGQFSGALQLTVDASVMLYPLLRTWPTPSQSGETLIVRRDGDEVLWLSDLRRRADAALRIRAPIDSPTLVAARALRGNTSGFMEGTDYDGVPVLAAYRRLEGTSWMLVAKVDQAEAFAPLREGVYSVTIGITLVTGIVGLFLRNLRQQRLRPLADQQLRLERQSRATSERLAYLMQHAGEVILLFDHRMRIVEANQRVHEVYGWSPQEMLDLTAHDLRAESARQHVESDFVVAQQGGGVAIETVHVRKDGRTFPVEVSARSVIIDGRPHVLSIIRDISVRKQLDEEIARLSRLYFVISQINQTLLHVKTPAQLFAAVCEVLVKSGGFRIAWVGSPDPATGGVARVAVAGDTHGYTNGIRISMSGEVPEGRGPVGTAWRENRVVVCNDFFNDAATQPWRDRATNCGFQSVIALPIRAEGRAVGVLTVYAAEKDFFAEREVNLLEETVDNMSFALAVFAQEAQRQAIEHEQRKLSLVVEQSPTSVMITDLEGRIEYVNPHFTQVTGYALEDVRGQNPRMLKSGLTDPGVYTDLWHTITRGDQWRGEIINRRKNGDYFTEQVLIAPVKDATGRATHYVALKEDITERKRVEAALLESEAKFRRLFAMVPVPMGHSDALGNITYANDRYRRTFGYSVAEVPTVRAWWDKAYPDPHYRAVIADKWADAVRVAAAGAGDIPPMECSVTCRDGQVRTVEISGMLMGGEMLIMFADISERVRANKRMRQMSRIIEQAPISIAITDLRGQIEYVNPAFLELSGYSEAELLGKNPRVLKSGLTPRETYSEMWSTITRGAVWRGELSNKRKNGEIHQERVVIAPVTDETGRITHFAALKEDVTKTKQTEQELLQSNERFRALFESNMDGLLITEPGGNILAANPAACAILRRTEKDIVGTGRAGIVDPTDPRLLTLLEERRRVGKARGILTMCRGDGSSFEAEVTSALFGSGAQQRAGIAIRDITTRLEAEEALRESEARYRELFDLESDAILVYTTKEGKIVQANSAAAALYGVPMERLVGMLLRDLSAEPEATDATRRQLPDHADEIIRVPLRYHRRADGAVFPVGGSIRTFRRGGELLAVGVIRDISDQMHAQDQMRRFNEQLEAKVVTRTEEIAAANREMQALLQSISDLVMRVNRGGVILNFQPAKGATPLAHLDRAELTGSGNGLAGALRELARTVGDKVLAEGTAVVTEHELTSDAGPVAVELRAATVTRDDYVVFVRDVSARKRFEAEMAEMLDREHQISEMKPRFISVTSHEFRTPMAAALGSVELLSNHLDGLTRAKRHELLTRITQSLLRMTEMLDEILLLNRMDANRVEVRLGTVDLPTFVRNLIEEIKLGDREGHVMELECPGSIAGFVTDTSLLHHILGNVLSNAVRYSPAGTRVHVTIVQDATQVRIAVEDQGIGIPADDLQRIFLPFERGSNVGNIKGTGLGLNIVKRMTDMLHGNLDVRSSPAGSCFTVTFPRTLGSTPPS